MTEHLQRNDVLTLQQQFRLIEIAHETHIQVIRDACLKLLYPSVMVDQAYKATARSMNDAFMKPVKAHPLPPSFNEVTE